MERSATPRPKEVSPWRDLFWYTAAASAVVGLAPGVAKAQGIVYTDIDDVFIEGTTENAEFPVDFDGDGDPEVLMFEDDGRNYTQGYEFVADAGETYSGIIGSLIPFQGVDYAYPLPLAAGMEISDDSEDFIPAEAFIGQNYLSFTFTFEGSDPLGWLGQEAYVGLRIELDDGAGGTNTHFGWLLVEIPAQGGAIILKSYAYESQPNTPIEAGDTGEGTSNEGDAAVTGTHRLSDAYPNPFTAATRFDLTVARAQRVKAELFNVLGQRVTTLFEGDLAAASPRTIDVEENGLPSGLYVVRVAGETFTDSFRVTLAK